jgi:hypothetical protein
VRKREQHECEQECLFEGISRGGCSKSHAHYKKNAERGHAAARAHDFIFDGFDVH